MKNIKKYNCAIIGAGPAGMMAAVRAAECGADVVLLEKNAAPGVKLLMTGKERCNITNAETDPKVLAGNFGRNGKFLLSALYRFGVPETIDFFNSNEVATKVERGGRIFPVSDKASDVRDLFLRLIEAGGITLKTGCEIKSVVHKNSEIEKLVLADGSEIIAKNYILSTGGHSYPRTGSTGDGYTWAKDMGHTVIKPKPALTLIVVKEKWVEELDKLSLKNVRVAVFQKGKKVDERFGEASFSGYCLNGPIILDMSKAVGDLIKKGSVRLNIDLKPALDHQKLDNRILRDLQKHPNKPMHVILAGLLPRQLIPVVLMLTGVDSSKKGNAITKEERKKLRLILKELPLTAKSLLGFNKAIVTSGGVSLKEVDQTTMRSKKIGNLFFAGEILDLDGPTGGYNLQVCWSTGYVAGEYAAGS